MMDSLQLEGGCRSVPEAPGQVPVLSVIVVVFQDCAELHSLIDNLAQFRASGLEIIVIDGGSDDGTVDLLRQRNDLIDFWLSEPDSGVYDGMNKGIRRARGRYVLHINAGDRLLRIPKVLLEQNINPFDVVCCRVSDGEGGVFVPRNNWVLRYENTWHHQGTFYLRAAHLGYDPQFRVFGDFDHNQRMSRKGVRVKLSKEIVASHRKNGLSDDERWYFEEMRCVEKNYGRLHLRVARIRIPLRNSARRIMRKIGRGTEIIRETAWVGPKRLFK